MLVFYLSFVILTSTPGYNMMLPSSSGERGNDEIDHTHFLVSDISNLYISNSFSDVVLDVSGEKLHVHRVVLALRSKHFSVVFYEHFKETYELEVPKSEVPLFKILLDYIYTGQIHSNVLKGGDVFKFFDMSDSFGVSYLKSGYVTPTSFSKKGSNKKIDHTHFMVSEISKLYLSKTFSDVVFVVDGERLPAHRVIIASRSKFFSALLYGGHKETYKSDVDISEVPVDLFKLLLKYIYTGGINLSGLEGTAVFELFKITDRYDMINLKSSLHDFLLRNIQVDGVCSLLCMAQLYQYKELEVDLLNLIDQNSLEVLQNEDFLNLSSVALQEMINRDRFYANELVLFQAVCRWISVNQEHLDYDTKVKVLSAVRYPLMSVEELSDAKKSQLVSLDIILEAIQLRNTLSTEKPQARILLKPNAYLEYQSHRPSVTDVNLIHRSQGFSVLNNNFGTNMIKLDILSVINYIEITLWYEPYVDHRRCYSYYIDVSTDGLDWVRVIDHSNYNCRSHQRLWIHPQVVRYIHFVRTDSTDNVNFKIRKVRYDTKNMHNVEIENGLVVPRGKYNVCSELYHNAILIHGLIHSRERNDISLLNDHYEFNARENNHTYHWLGSTLPNYAIVVHLTQPYILSSMRLLLGHYSNEAFGYTVESSLNNQEWVMLVDKSNELERYWQVLNFKPTPMLYIRLTGVYNSNGKDFRCVYLEAPSQVTLDSDVDEDDRAENNETYTEMAGTSGQTPY